MTYSPDVENSHEDHPLLGEGSTSSLNARFVKKGRFAKFLHFFGGGIYAPDASTYDPIEILLNEPDPEKKDKLTERWRDNRLSELSFVGVVVSGTCLSCLGGSLAEVQSDLYVGFRGIKVFGGF